jgi:hypothetical protein
MAGLFLHVFTNEMDRRLTALNLAPEAAAALDAERVKLGGAEVPANVRPSDRTMVDEILAAAFVSGFRWVALLAAALALASSATAALMIDRDSRERRSSVLRNPASFRPVPMR